MITVKSQIVLCLAWHIIRVLSKLMSAAMRRQRWIVLWRSLWGKMTLHEKLGQLNLPFKRRHGNRYGNEWRVERDMIRKQGDRRLLQCERCPRINALQRLAVEESRLKIPFACGWRHSRLWNDFPLIPLALSCRTRWPSNAWHVPCHWSQCGWHQLDIQSDGWYLSGCPLGTYCGREWRRS